MELVSPVLYCHHQCHYEYHVKKIDGATIKIDFKLDFDQDEPGGILIHKIQSNTRSNHQSINEETSRMMLFLVNWKMNCLWWPEAKIILVEYDDQLDLNEDRLAQFYDNIKDMLTGYYVNTRFVCDNAVMNVECDLIPGKGSELKINISEGVESEYTIRPNLWIDSKRQVSSLVTIYFTNLYD
jgi:hypothetical protein